MIQKENIFKVKKRTVVEHTKGNGEKFYTAEVVEDKGRMFGVFKFTQDWVVTSNDNDFHYLNRTFGDPELTYYWATKFTSIEEAKKALEEAIDSHIKDILEETVDTKSFEY